ncbi:MAG: hypothetical protein K1W02_02960 [Muribaculaceae bacterium]
MPDLILSLIKLIALLAALAFLALILLFLFWTVYMLIPKKWRRKFKPRSKSFATIETPQILPGPLPYQGTQWSSSLLPIKETATAHEDPTVSGNEAAHSSSSTASHPQA